MRYKLKAPILIHAILYILSYIPHSYAEYASLDEPSCREDCFSLTEPGRQDECLTAMMEFYSYKMIKGIFNYGKTAIYAGLWNNRYEKADPELFKDVFDAVLKQYNSTSVLGGLDYDQLNTTASFIFEQLEKYSVKQSSGQLIEYGSYPSLQCPNYCSHEVGTWQAMFYLSLTIFILSAITISLYSIFLRKQYDSLKGRLKVLKYTANN